MDNTTQPFAYQRTSAFGAFIVNLIRAHDNFTSTLPKVNPTENYHVESLKNYVTIETAFIYKLMKHQM